MGGRARLLRLAGLTSAAVCGLTVGAMLADSQAAAQPVQARQAAAAAAADFSGSWSAGQGGGGRGGSVAANLGSGWGSDITIVQTASTLTVERIFFTGGDLQPPIVNTVLMGRGEQTFASTTTWQGDRLVIATRYTFAGPDGRPMMGEMRRTLWLQSSSQPSRPPSLVVETVRSGVLGGPPSTTRTVYSKG